MLRIQEIKLPLDTDETELPRLAAKTLKIPQTALKSVSVFRKSLDCRKKNDIKFIFALDAEVDGNEEKILAKIHNPKVSKAEIYQIGRAHV